MIPFIDPPTATISFSLITAVWSHTARINADAQVPGPPRPDTEQEKVEPEKIFHIEMRQPEKSPHVEAGRAGRQLVRHTPSRRREGRQERQGRPLPGPRSAHRRGVEEHGRTAIPPTRSSTRPCSTPTTTPSTLIDRRHRRDLRHAPQDELAERQAGRRASVQRHLRGSRINTDARSEPGRRLMHSVPLNFVVEKAVGHGRRGTNANLSLTSIYSIVVVVADDVQLVGGRCPPPGPAHSPSREHARHDRRADGRHQRQPAARRRRPREHVCVFRRTPSACSASTSSSTSLGQARGVEAAAPEGLPRRRGLFRSTRTSPRSSRAPSRRLGGYPNVSFMVNQLPKSHERAIIGERPLGCVAAQRFFFVEK